MAFFEQLFPPDISRDANGGPRFYTRKAYTGTGQRITNREATYPLHDYSIAQPVKTGADFEVLRAFFYVVGGDADAFRFKDWSDYKGVHANTALILTTGSTYQMHRLYSVGSRTFQRPIYKPVAGATIYRNRSGVITDVTASCTVATTTGLVTVNSGHVAGDSYTWAGEFHVPVAFKDPAAVWRVIGTSSMLTEWTGIELEEVLL